MSKKIVVIGSGFSSLAAACYLAKAGNEVIVYEKNQTIGGRARQLKKEGFVFIPKTLAVHSSLTLPITELKVLASIIISNI